MEIKGKIVQLLPIVEGQGKKGKWVKQDAIIETPGQYPKKVCISLWGEELINKYDLQVGLEVTAHINAESREHSGRWYTELRAWKITWDEQAARKWQNGNQSLKDAPAFSNEREDTSLRSHYEGQNSLGSEPVDDALPF